MRINIYDHELKWMMERSELISKPAEGINYHGVRFYTEASLMHKPNDDDSSAITLWVADGDTKPLRIIARDLLRLCDRIDARRF